MKNEEEKRMQTILDEYLDAGVRKMLIPQFGDLLTIDPNEFADLQKLVDNYGHVLTSEEVAKLKELRPDIKFNP